MKFSRAKRLPGLPKQSQPRGAVWLAVLSFALCGLLAAVALAPASWLAAMPLRYSDGRIDLMESQGTVWHGSAVLVLRGGSGSTDAARLPERVSWKLGPGWHDGYASISLHLHASCCMLKAWQFALKPRIEGLDLHVHAPQANLPAALLAGLGTPWNTMAPQGVLQLSSDKLLLKSRAGRLEAQGSSRIDLLDVRSRLSTLAPLGSYRLDLLGSATPTLKLQTLSGVLQVTGNGQWVGGRLRFSGTASAQSPFEDALQNLLNIVGRRQGAQSIISIG